jgi:SAM-dependent methyltransferase
MRRFWDARARENALFYIDSGLDYRYPDPGTFWQRGAAIVDRIVGELGVPIGAEDNVVEIGCGIGRLTRPLAARAGRVIALDVSAEMIERAQDATPNLEGVEWRVGDGISLAGIDDASIDAVISHVVFQHIPDPEITLGYVREMGRVLRPGGRAGFQVSNRPEIHRPQDPGLSGRVRELGGRQPRGQRDPAWLGAPTDLKRLRAVAAESGMETERVVNEGTQWCFVVLRRA